MRPTPLRSVAIAKRADDQSWRMRTLMVLGLLVAAVMAAGAVTADWSEGVEMALGQLAGLAAPLLVIGLLVWAACSVAGQRRS